MFRMTRLALGAAALCVVAAPVADAQTVTGEQGQGHGPFAWVTLGTQGGPMTSMKRSEPANLLVRDGEAILVDAGDDAMTRLVGAGAKYPWLTTVFLSHLHIDHVGGLFAVLGLRNQTQITRPLTIYGPRGTRQLVAGLIAALTPSAEAAYGVPGEAIIKADTNIRVVELEDGSTVKLGDIKVTAAQNSHYSFPKGSEFDRQYQSLSYRFDLPERSIVYTGDTGPSINVQRLATGADLLISEMVDLDAVHQTLAERAKTMDARTLAAMAQHMSTQHLSPEQVGQLAAAAGVKRVVLTHLAGGGAPDPDAASRYAAQVHRRFTGPVTVANDMDRF